MRYVIAFLSFFIREKGTLAAEERERKKDKRSNGYTNGRKRRIKLLFTFGINTFFYTGTLSGASLVNTNAMVTRIPFSNTMLKNTMAVRKDAKRIQMFINLRLIPDRMRILYVNKMRTRTLYFTV